MNNREREIKERAERLNQILEEQSSRYRVEYVSGLKDSLILDGYLLKEENAACCPVFYYDEEMFQKNDMELIEEMNVFFSVAKEVPISAEILQKLDADYIYSHVFARFVPSERIETVKERDVFLTNWLDLGVSFFVDLKDLIPEVGMDAGIGVKVTNTLIAYCQVESERLPESALRNMELQKDISSMFQVLIELTGKDWGETEPKMIVVSNKDKSYGASVIMLPSVIEQLKEIFGDTFVVIPSSIHECIIIGFDESENFQLEGLTEIVREVNRTQIEEADFLSDNVYYYYDGKMNSYERCVVNEVI